MAGQQFFEILIGSLIFIFLLIIFVMSFANSFQGSAGAGAGAGAEGFENKESQIELRSRTVIDKFITPANGLCPLYTTIRTNMRKNEKAEGISDTEANKRVEAALAIKIPGGALPCPLITYPKPGSTDVEWLGFLQEIPTDFGARIVFMTLYAKDSLATTESTLRAALSGNGVPPGTDEGFTVCSPTVADTRRAEAAVAAATREEADCQLPDEMTPAEIQDTVTELLKKLVASRNTILRDRKIDPLLDLQPIIKEAKASADYITQKANEAQSGTLAMDPSTSLGA